MILRMHLGAAFRRGAMALLGACFAATPTWAQQAPAPANRAKAAGPAMMSFHDLTISPDGRRAAWLSASDILVEDLTEEARQPHKVAEGVQFAWSPDSRQLAFIAGNDYRQQQLYVVNATRGAARKVTSVHGALMTPQWSPDGKTLAVLYVENPPREPGSTVPIPRPVGHASHRPFEQRLALIDVASTEIRLVSPDDLYIWEYDWSPNGSQIVVNAAPGDGDNNWYFPHVDVITLTSGKLQTLLTPDIQIKYPRWSPDGKQIAFIGGLMAGDLVGNYGDVYVLPATGGNARNLTPKWPASAYRIAWLSADQILIREVADGDVGLVTLDMNGVTERLWKGANFSAQGGSLDELSVSKDRKTSVAVLKSLGHPPEIWIGAIGAWRQFSHFNDDVQPKPAKSESLHWASDQWRIQGWLTYPRNYDPRKRYPLVVFVHGGPSGLVTGGCTQAFAADGYFALCPNFRGSAGFGQDFIRANMKDFGYGDFRDIVTGVEYVLKTFPIDKNRVGITGHSYGGYMSMWAVTQTDLFHAAVPSAGISDWLSYVGEADISNWVLPYFGVSIYDDHAIYARTAPMTYIKNVKTPTLLLVGADDGECPATQSIEFWRALRALGVKTELVIYPNEGHGFTRPEDSQDRTLRTIKWFNQYLK